jgi:8-oxo-dGTP diphosphatase
MNFNQLLISAMRVFLPSVSVFIINKTKMAFTYEYQRPMVTTDILLFSGEKDHLKILLIRRGKEPYKDCWALPGGFLEMDEELDACARRELKEETGITGIELKELFTVGTIGRDPRGRTITIMFYAFTEEDSVLPKAGDDAAEVKWFTISKLPEKLAFDHAVVLRRAIDKIAK